MRARTKYSPVLVLAGLALLAGGGAAVEPGAKTSVPKVKRTPYEGSCICPVYPWAFHGTYWSYYAIDCNSTPVNLDAEPNLQSTSCQLPDCFEDCQQVGPDFQTTKKTKGKQAKSKTKRPKATDKKAKTLRNPSSGRCKRTDPAVAGSMLAPTFSQWRQHDGTADGIGKSGFRRERGPTFKPRIDRLAVTASTASIIVEVRPASGQGTSFKAKLMKYTINPANFDPPRKDLPIMHVRVGYQVTDASTASHGTVSGADVMRPFSRKRCYSVKFGGEWYQVHCHRRRP